MSQVFEKETAASTAKSLVGALTGLGSGFLFLFLALVVLTASAGTAHGDGAPGRQIVATLRADLIGLKPGSLRVSKDHDAVAFQRHGVEVKYVFDAVSGEVTRSSDGSSKGLGKLKKLSFQRDSNLLRIEWSTANTSERTSWAIDRWGKP